MKNSVKILLSLLVIFAIAAIIFVGVKFSKGNEDENQNHENNISSDNNVSISSGEGSEILQTKFEYLDLSELSGEYSVEEAISDSCFVIAEKIYNENILNAFCEGIKNKQESNLRVVQMTIKGDLIILDLSYSGDTIRCIEDNSRDEFSESIEVLTNEYKLSDGYYFDSKVVTLEDGTELITYSLENNSIPENAVPLFAYQENDLTDADMLPNQFDATVKSIDENSMVVVPDESMTERNVSEEVFITLENGTFDGVTFEVNQKIKITYTGEITESADIYQIENIISIE